MPKLVTILALAAVALPSGVFARGAEQRFTRKGVTYVYTVAPAKGGRQIVEGRRLPSGSAFRLVVSGNRVDGTSGGQPVAFQLPVKPATEVAAR